MKIWNRLHIQCTFKNHRSVFTKILKNNILFNKLLYKDKFQSLINNFYEGIRDNSYMTQHFWSSDGKPRKSKNCENRFYRELDNWFTFPWQLWVQNMGNGDGHIQTKKCINCVIYHKYIRFLVKHYHFWKFTLYALVHQFIITEQFDQNGSNHSSSEKW